jgi:hypothetical protein
MAIAPSPAPAKTPAVATFARSHGPALALVVAMAAVASLAGHRELLFPEFGALAAGVLIHRLPPWRARPLDIFAFPVAAALIGVGVNVAGMSPQLGWAVALGAILVLMRAGSSSMVPSISAALLPVLLDFTSLLYPLAVAATAGALALLALRHNRATATPPGPPQPSIWLLVTFWMLGSMWGIAAFSLGVKYAAVPPILVAGLELMKTRGAQAAPKAIVLAASVVAGVATHLLISSWPLDAAVAFLAVWLLCRAGRVVLPPAYALGLLPLLIDTATQSRFLVASACGSLGFVALVWIWTRLTVVPVPAPVPASAPARASFDVQPQASLSSD